MKFGVITFPGSNCDFDIIYVLRDILRRKVEVLWHKDHDLKSCDMIVLPGGFSYGDYLRPGAMARFSPVMESVVRFAREGGLVIGICNGFQILCEAGLLPGALVRNRTLQFLCSTVVLRVEEIDTPFTRSCSRSELLRVPVKHGSGCFVAQPETVREIEEKRQVVLRYVDAAGRVTEEANPNGSLNNIAGIVNAQRNVFGLMPHPEHACERLLGSEDGLRIFRSVQSSIAEGAGTTRAPVAPGL